MSNHDIKPEDLSIGKSKSRVPRERSIVAVESGSAAGKGYPDRSIFTQQGNLVVWGWARDSTRRPISAIARDYGAK